MAVKDENSLVLQQLKHPQDAETSEEKKIRYRLEELRNFRVFNQLCLQKWSLGNVINVLVSSSIWTCRILNICFDFFHYACLQKQQQIFDIFKIDELLRRLSFLISSNDFRQFLQCKCVDLFLDEMKEFNLSSSLILNIKYLLLFLQAGVVGKVKTNI